MPPQHGACILAFVSTGSLRDSSYSVVPILVPIGDDCCYLEDYTRLDRSHILAIFRGNGVLAEITVINLITPGQREAFNFCSFFAALP